MRHVMAPREWRDDDVWYAEAELSGASLRVDAVRPSLDRKAVMAAAPESDGRFFKVPKVIER